ncbi:TonB-dependent receptor plug domain-containing protein [Fibrobacterota bacterium]
MILKRITVILLFKCFICLAQTISITVLDSANSNPIRDVSIYNQSELLGRTDSKGLAHLPPLHDTTTLKFLHDAYIEKRLTIKKINELSNTIKLAPSVVTLDKMVVSASKWEEDKKEVPVKINTITKKEADFFNPQTSADLLSASNEVFVQKSQLGGGSPMIRGFSANSVLLVIDGVRMNNAIYRSGNLQNVISLDPNTIERTEVIFGPGSIIYGSDALGGVFSFTSRNPVLSGNERFKITSDAMGRFSYANLEKTGHATVNIATKIFGSLSSFTYSDFDDLRMGKNGDYYDQYKRTEYVDRINNSDSIVENSDAAIQKISGYHQINVLQKFLLHPTEHFDLTSGFYFSTTSDIPRYDRLVQYRSGQLRYAEWYYGPQQWLMVNTAMHLTNELPVFDEMKINIAYQNYEESRHKRKYRNNELISNTEEVDAVTGNVDLNKSIGNKSVLSYGIEAVYNSVESVGKTKDIVTGEEGYEKSRYPAGYNDYATGALYSLFKTNWNNVLTTVKGLRYSYIHLESMFEDPDMPYQKLEINNGAFNVSLGLVIRPCELWQINLNTSSGYRAPNTDDVTKMFDPDSGSVVAPNDNLKPEYAYNVDFGTEGKIGKLLGLEATVYATYVKDLMVRDDFTLNGQNYMLWQGELKKIAAIVNKDKGYIFGVNGAAKFDFTPFLSLHNYLSYMWGRDSDGNPIRHIPPLFGSNHLLLTFDRLKTNFYVNYNAQIKAENMAPSEIEKPYMYAVDENGELFCPAWYTLNLKTSFKINKHLTLDAGVENITNFCYRPYSSGIVAPGVNGIFAVRAGF